MESGFRSPRGLLPSRKVLPGVAAALSASRHAESKSLPGRGFVARAQTQPAAQHSSIAPAARQTSPVKAFVNFGRGHSPLPKALISRAGTSLTSTISPSSPSARVGETSDKTYATIPAAVALNRSGSPTRAEQSPQHNSPAGVGDGPSMRRVTSRSVSRVMTQPRSASVAGVYADPSASVIDGPASPTGNGVVQDFAAALAESKSATHTSLGLGFPGGRAVSAAVEAPAPGRLANAGAESRHAAVARAAPQPRQAPDSGFATTVSDPLASSIAAVETATIASRRASQLRHRDSSVESGFGTGAVHMGGRIETANQSPSRRDEVLRKQSSSTSASLKQKSGFSGVSDNVASAFASLLGAARSASPTADLSVTSAAADDAATAAASSPATGAASSQDAAPALRVPVVNAPTSDSDADNQQWTPATGVPSLHPTASDHASSSSTNDDSVIGATAEAASRSASPTRIRTPSPDFTSSRSASASRSAAAIRRSSSVTLTRRSGSQPGSSGIAAAIQAANAVAAKLQHSMTASRDVPRSFSFTAAVAATHAQRAASRAPSPPPAIQPHRTAAQSDAPALFVPSLASTTAVAETDAGIVAQSASMADTVHGVASAAMRREDDSVSRHGAAQDFDIVSSAASRTTDILHTIAAAHSEFAQPRSAIAQAPAATVRQNKPRARSQSRASSPTSRIASATLASLANVLEQRGGASVSLQSAASHTAAFTTPAARPASPARVRSVSPAAAIAKSSLPRPASASSATPAASASAASAAAAARVAAYQASASAIRRSLSPKSNKSSGIAAAASSLEPSTYTAAAEPSSGQVVIAPAYSLVSQPASRPGSPTRASSPIRARGSVTAAAVASSVAAAAAQPDASFYRSMAMSRAVASTFASVTESVARDRAPSPVQVAHIAKPLGVRGASPSPPKLVPTYAPSASSTPMSFANSMPSTAWVTMAQRPVAVSACATAQLVSAAAAPPQQPASASSRLQHRPRSASAAPLRVVEPSSPIEARRPAPIAIPTPAVSAVVPPAQPAQQHQLQQPLTARTQHRVEMAASVLDAYLRSTTTGAGMMSSQQSAYVNDQYSHDPTSVSLMQVPVHNGNTKLLVGGSPRTGASAAAVVLSQPAELPQMPSTSFESNAGRAKPMSRSASVARARPAGGDTNGRDILQRQPQPTPAFTAAPMFIASTPQQAMPARPPSPPSRGSRRSDLHEHPSTITRITSEVSATQGGSSPTPMAVNLSLADIAAGDVGQWMGVTSLDDDHDGQGGGNGAGAMPSGGRSAPEYRVAPAAAAPGRRAMATSGPGRALLEQLQWIQDRSSAFRQQVGSMMVPQQQPPQPAPSSYLQVLHASAPVPVPVTGARRSPSPVKPLPLHRDAGASPSPSPRSLSPVSSGRIRLDVDQGITLPFVQVTVEPTAASANPGWSAPLSYRSASGGPAFRVINRPATYPMATTTVNGSRGSSSHNGGSMMSPVVAVVSRVPQMQQPSSDAGTAGRALSPRRSGGTELTSGRISARSGVPGPSLTSGLTSSIAALTAASLDALKRF